MSNLNGTFKGKARTWTLAESPEKKTPEVAVEFVLSDPQFEGASMTWHGYLSEKAFDRTIESLRHCGWKGDDLSDLTGLDANEVDLVIKDEEYNGKVYPKIQFVNRAGGLAVKEPMSPTKAKEFAAAMRGKIRAYDAATGRKTPNGSRVPLGAPGSEPPEDLDVPF